VDDDFIATVKTNVKDAATSLRLGMLPAKPAEKSCSVCDFKMLCSDGCKFVAKPTVKGA
jgi:DNA helicase-2/ATP-dependent DNA helicase PcrA